MDIHHAGERLQGFLIGTAVGDALGLPYEGMSPEQAARRLGPPDRHRFCCGKGMVSDDTEHAVLTTLAALNCERNTARFQKQLAFSLKAWLWRLPAGVGFATLRSLLKASLGYPPAKSGVFSAGNGPAMRSGSLGLLYGNDPDFLWEIVRASTVITHTDPKAVWGAWVHALAVWQAAQAMPPEGQALLDAVKARSKKQDGGEEWIQRLEAVLASVARRESVKTFAESIGSKKGVSGYILHTVPCVLHVWLRKSNQYGAAITEIIEAGGDTDTTAALLGGLIGASHGEDAIPIPWREGLRDTPLSLDYLRNMARTASSITSTPLPRPSASVWFLRNLFFTTVVLAHGFARLIPLFLFRKQPGRCKTAREAVTFAQPDSPQPRWTYAALWDQFDLRTSEYGYWERRGDFPDCRLLNWIGSVDYSGYVREKCLKDLIVHYVEGDENRILLRLTDWVPNVTRPAVNWTTNQFPELLNETVWRNQKLLLYLARQQISPQAWNVILQSLKERLETMSLGEFQSLKPSFRKFLITRFSQELPVLRQWCLLDPEPTIRLRLLDPKLIQDWTPEEIQSLSNDRNPWVRRRFLQAGIDRGWMPPRPLLESMAMDNRRSTRQFAQYYLRTLYLIDPLSLYENRLDDSRFFVADVLRAVDLPLFLKGLRHSSPCIQEICLSALIRVNPNHLRELDLHSLISKGNRSIRKLLIPQIPRLCTLEEVMALRSAFETTSQNGTAIFMGLLEKKSYWAFLEHLTREYMTMPEALATRLRKRAAAKTEVYSQPTEALRKQILQNLDALEASPSFRDPSFTHFVRFVLR